MGTWLLAGFAVEAWALLGERDLAASLYPALLHGVSLGLRATPTQPIETIVGIAAACGRQWAQAEDHFERARQDCEDLPHLPGSAETRYWQAWALLEQGAAGDGDRVRTLLEDAVSVSWLHRRHCPSHDVAPQQERFGDNRSLRALYSGADN